MRRRAFLSLIAASALAGCETPPDDTTPTQTGTPTTSTSTKTRTTTDTPQFIHPKPPEKTTPKSVFKSAQGTLQLTPDHPYWIWKVDHYDGCVTLEYEVELSDDPVGGIDVLVLSDRAAVNRYKDKVTDNGWWESLDDDGKRILRTRIADPPSQERVTSAHSIATKTDGSYWVVFDATDTVRSDNADGVITGTASVRAKNPITGQAEQASTKEVERFYGSFADGEVIEATEEIAEEICNTVPAEYINGVDPARLGNAPMATLHLAPVLRGIGESVGTRTGFRSPYLVKVADNLSVLAGWATTLLPLLGSAQQVFKSACNLAQLPATASRERRIKRVESLLLDIGILVAQGVASWFGVTGAFAAKVTRFADEYLLALLRERLSLRLYVLLLRELYVTVYGLTADVLGMIKEKTRSVANTVEFFHEQDVEKVEGISDEELFEDDESFLESLLDDESACETSA